MKNKYNINALIFDFDGLIVDTETTDFQAWQETYAAYGCTFPQDIWDEIIGTHLVFDPIEHLEGLVGHSLDKAAVREKRNRREAELFAAQPVLPGVMDYLAEARTLGMKIGIASSSKHDWVDGHLQRLGLTEWFDIVCCSDDVYGRTKPDPAVYLFAAAALNVEPDHALAFEDSANGALAAKRAGMTCIVVPNDMTRHLDFTTAAPDRRLNSLADLPLTQLLTELIPVREVLQ